MFAVLADDEDHVVMLAETASVPHTHQSHAPPRGLAVHLSLQVLAHSTLGLYISSLTSSLGQSLRILLTQRSGDR